MAQTFELQLEKQAANYSALTPVSLLQRSAGIYPSKTAVIDDRLTLSYAQLYQRTQRMASALQQLGINKGDTVAVLCFNTFEMLESHYSVPMSGAVLNTLNTRLDAATLRFILEHAQAKALIYDTELEPLVREVIDGMASSPLLIATDSGAGPSQGLTALTYEAVLDTGDPAFQWERPSDEWDAISLNYTSGTTGRPKGVVYHHRGAYLAAMSNVMAFNVGPDSVYLWTLPMFHCNGWCYTWAVTAVGATHVCLRRVVNDDVWAKIQAHGVTHMCGAPIVLNSMINDFHDKGHILDSTVRFAVGGAAPHSVILGRAQKIGFDITHLYGLTESYGPSALCVWQDSWNDLSSDALASKMARQGVGTFAIDSLLVAASTGGRPVPADGQTMGELLMRGNTLMKGYLNDPAATESAFHSGWFHTGDLAVVHPDGYVEIKDRIKDIIISGGENISSHEIEDTLYRHPAVLEAAVIALADSKWGEVPCAFVTLRDDASAVSADELIAFCRKSMASFKVPKKIVFGDLPKTSTGKIQKNVLRDQLQPRL